MSLSESLVDPIFRVDGKRVVTSPDAAGPWDPRMQHGSAPAALVVWAAEAIPTPVPMQISRVTIDLMRPVPVAPLTIETEILREGRKIQLCTVSLKADGVVVVGASVLKIKSQALALPPEISGLPVELPGPDQSIVEPANFAGSPFVKCISMRAVVAADFSNGTAAVLDFRQWTFINADLTVSFARQPVGDWVLLDGESFIGPDGAGLATARLADRSGYFGRAVQSLVIEQR
jgi:Thioesterase-like superfamily